MTFDAESRFSELIRQLEDVHLSEVKNLRLENLRLRAMSPNGVQDADVKRFTIDLDSPDSEAKFSSGTAEEFQDTPSENDQVKDDKEVNFQESESGAAHTGANESAPHVQPRPSLLRNLNMRYAGEYGKRSHWENVPESARAAWEQATDVDSIEEQTAYAMSALAKPSLIVRNSSMLLQRCKTPNPCDARSRLSRRSMPGRISAFITNLGMPMVDPSTMYRVAWDFNAVFLIVYDLLTIPLLVFELEENLFTDFMGWTCLLFWTADIMASCCTGIYIDGHLVMSRNIIVKRYLKSWFTVDCIAVIPDWIFKFLDSAGEFGRVGGVVRMARGTRVLRLLRLAKLKKLMNEFYDMISNEYMFILVDLVKLLTIILVLCHVVACAWYGVGHVSLEIGVDNWLQDVGRSPVYDGDFAWKYSTCLHWSITQFTAASLDIFATNTGERIFSVVIIFWGLVGLSSFIGSVTTTITALRNMSNDQQKQFWLLRKYLAQCRISQHLTVRILRYLEFKAVAKRNILPASKVVLLSQLSEQLCSQLKKETNNSILAVHPFFSVLGLQLTSSMGQLCNQALKGTEYAEEDVVFSAAQEAAGMFFVKAGMFRYSGIDLQRKDFASEAALWTSWSHREKLVAIGDINEIICILHERFGEVMCMNPQAWNFAQFYATDFVKALNEHDPDLLSDISMNGFVKSLRNSISNDSDRGKRLHAGGSASVSASASWLTAASVSQ